MAIPGANESRTAKLSNEQWTITFRSERWSRFVRFVGLLALTERFQKFSAILTITEVGPAAAAPIYHVIAPLSRKLWYFKSRSQMKFNIRLGGPAFFGATQPSREPLAKLAVA